MKKILFVVTQSDLGGAQAYILKLSRALKEHGYDVAVAAGGHEGMFAALETMHIPTHRLAHLTRPIQPLKDIQGYWELKDLCRAIKPDVVHLNSSKAGLIGALAARRAGVRRIVYTVHGFVFNEPMSAWQKKLYILIERFSARFKDALICVSDFDREAGLRHHIAPASKFLTIHHGIEPIDFKSKSEARKSLGLPPDGLIIGTIANTYATKGLPYLVQSAATITLKYPGVHFRIIGSGPMDQELRTQVKRLGLEQRVSIEPMHPAQPYLRAFDLYIQPSIKEGFPYAILEAMAAGLPIIATNVGGIPEMIRHGHDGLLVPASDVDALTKAIQQALDDPALRQRLGQAAEQKISREFGFEKFLSATREVY